MCKAVGVARNVPFDTVRWDDQALGLWSRFLTETWQSMD